MNGFRDTDQELKDRLAAVGVDYNPATGNGYDIGGELVWTNGNWNNAVNLPSSVYELPPKPAPDYSQYLIWGLVGFGLIYLLGSKGKRR